jgi:hypothetical protein
LSPAIHRSQTLNGSLFQQQHPCSTSDPHPCQELHALAPFEQGIWLKELDLLHLDDAMKRNALTHGGDDDTAVV